MNLTVYGQRDSQWAGDKINGTSSTLGSYGCTISCLGMLTDRNPRDANNWLKSLGAFQSDLVLWGKVPGFQPNGRFYCVTTAAPMEEIKREINAGFPVLLQVDLVGNDDKPDHWVLGVEVQGNNIVINDPYYGERALITKRYGPTAAVAILGGAYFDISKLPAPPPPPVDPCAEIRAQLNTTTTRAVNAETSLLAANTTLNAVTLQRDNLLTNTGIIEGKLTASQALVTELDDKVTVLTRERNDLADQLNAKPKIVYQDKPLTIGQAVSFLVQVLKEKFKI